MKTFLELFSADVVQELQRLLFHFADTNKHFPVIWRFIGGNRKKSHGARSGEQEGWGIIVMLFCAKKCFCDRLVACWSTDGAGRFGRYLQVCHRGEGCWEGKIMPEKHLWHQTSNLYTRSTFSIGEASFYTFATFADIAWSLQWPGYELDKGGTSVWFPAGARDFFSSPKLPDGSGVHPVFCSVRIGGSFPRS